MKASKEFKKILDKQSDVKIRLLLSKAFVLGRESGKSKMQQKRGKK